MNLPGKIALITGGTKGIGAATALRLARAGATVVINGRHRDEDAEATLAQLRSISPESELLLADCSKPADAGRLVHETASRRGALDILIHAAGGPVNGRLLEITPEDWYAAFDTHVHPIYHLCRAAIPLLKPRGEGAIVLVSSTAGIRGVATNIAYQAAKGAIPQITRALARELADDNIRVNCVAPGVIRTAFHKAMTEAQRKLNLEHRIPLHREGTADQVASLVVEMIANDYLTGETFTIDGGLTMRIA